MRSSRFDQQISKCLAELMRSDDAMCRTQLIETLEQGLSALGLQPIVSAYISATFGARSLRELEEDDLAQALKVIARLEQLPAAERPIPIPTGTQVDGELLWFRGRTTWGPA